MAVENILLEVTQHRSSYGSSAAKQASLRSLTLGNKRRGRTVLRSATRQQAGYVRAVHDLVKVRVVLVDQDELRGVRIDAQQAIRAIEVVRPAVPTEASRPISLDMVEDALVAAGLTVGSGKKHRPVVSSISEPHVASFVSGIDTTGQRLSFADGSWVTVEDEGFAVISWPSPAPVGRVFQLRATDAYAYVEHEGRVTEGRMERLPCTAAKVDLLRIEQREDGSDVAFVWQRLPDRSVRVSLLAYEPSPTLLSKLMSETAQGQAKHRADSVLELV